MNEPGASRSTERDAADLAEIEAIKARGPVWVSNEDAQRQMNEWLDEVDAAADQTR